MLERAKIVEIVKGTDHNRPLTVCRITPVGRKRYLEYLETLEQVVRDAAKVTREETAADELHHFKEDLPGCDDWLSAHGKGD